ncbi:MAG: hypothetical protein JO051_16475 [Acidobacteriaceae bacterium]|nr:hypothetical protein [Acidobacteriaceae bacterium]
MTRRVCLSTVATAALVLRRAHAQTDQQDDWVCPMHPDYRASAPGICPRCGMKLVLGIPDRAELPLELTSVPTALRVGENFLLRLRVLEPASRLVERHFEIVHEKLMHVFLVSESLQSFAHLHPKFKDNGCFELPLCLQEGGMYRLLADFYPSGFVPQLAVSTFYVNGRKSPQHLAPELTPCKATNLVAALRLEPEQPTAGLETRLDFTLDPGEGIERYLGAWAHMLIASADLIDLIHIHPFLTDEHQHMQFNVIFPRPGLYRVWTQFQRLGEVNTTEFTIPVTSI